LTKRAKQYTIKPYNRNRKVQRRNENYNRDRRGRQHDQNLRLPRPGAAGAAVRQGGGPGRFGLRRLREIHLAERHRAHRHRAGDDHRRRLGLHFLGHLRVKDRARQRVRLHRPRRFVPDRPAGGGHREHGYGHGARPRVRRQNRVPRRHRRRRRHAHRAGEENARRAERRYHQRAGGGGRSGTGRSAHRRHHRPRAESHAGDGNDGGQLRQGQRHRHQRRSGAGHTESGVRDHRYGFDLRRAQPRASGRHPHRQPLDHSAGRPAVRQNRRDVRLQFPHAGARTVRDGHRRRTDVFRHERKGKE